MPLVWYFMCGHMLREEPDPSPSDVHMFICFIIIPQ